MIFKALIQVILTLALVEFAPFDASILEHRAETQVTSRPLGWEELIKWSIDPMPVLAMAAAPVKVDNNSLGILTTAASALVLDQASQTILFEKNIDQTRSIGSITKLMTAYLVTRFGVDLAVPAAVSEEDLRVGGHLYLYLNDQVTGRNLLQASLVGSDNSATIALVRLTGLSSEEFVQQMNQTAKTLGLNQTTFVDPTGLSVDNRSTTRDIARLLDIVLEDVEIRQAVTSSQVAFRSTSGIDYLISNTDELLNSFINQPPFRIVGGKTGYLPEAGYCLALEVQENNEHNIFVVVLGSVSKEDRFQEVKGLTQWAYDTFDWPDEQ